MLLNRSSSSLLVFLSILTFVISESPLIPRIACPLGCICSYWRVKCTAGNLTAIPRAGYNRISELWLQGNKIKEIKSSDFEAYRSLSRLYLSGNPIKKIPSFVFLHVKTLRTLTISADVIEEGAFHGLTRVTTLSISGSKNLADIPVSVFKPLKQLATVTINGTNIKTVKQYQFAGLEKLIRLRLYDNKISSVSETAFVGSPNLQEITLDRNQITSLSAKVFNGMQALSKLNLTNNQIIQIDENTFSELPALRELGLGNNKLSDLPNTIFQKLVRLNILNLQSNNLTKVPTSVGTKHSNTASIRKGAKLPSMLSKLYVTRYKLSHLYLNDNQLTKFNITDFSELKSLRVLKLQRNKLTAFNMKTATSLQQLDISFNCLDQVPQFNSLLNKLGIANCCLKNFNNIKIPRSLYYLDAHGNNFPNVTIKKSIRIMNFSSCKVETLQTSSFYYRFSTIDLSGNPSLKSILGRFNGLRELYLKACNLPSFNLSSIRTGYRGLSAISMVDLSRNKIINVGDIDLTNVNLEILRLNGNQISKLDENALSNQAATLRELHLQKNKINDVSNSLNTLVSLTKLDLSNNQLANIDGISFASLLSLKELNLNNNTLTNIPVELLALSDKLNVLDLSGTNNFQCNCNLTIAVNSMAHKKNSLLGECIEKKSQKKQSLPSLIMSLTELSKKTNCDLCSLSPCNYRGVCAPNKTTGFTCTCHSGYKGDSCEIYSYNCHLTQQCNLCNKTVCGDFGSCTETSPKHLECKCAEGFSGDRCEKTDPCMVNKCMYGVCVDDKIGNYTCKCDHGYTGTLCDKNPLICPRINGRCNEKPCRNGGTCCEIGDRYRCFCTENFTGRKCQLLVPDKLTKTKTSDSKLTTGSIAAIALGLVLLLLIVVIVWLWYTKRMVLSKSFGGSLHYNVSHEKTLIDNENDF